MFSSSDKLGEKEKIPIIVKIPNATINEKVQDYLMTISLCMKEMRSVRMIYCAKEIKEATGKDCGSL
jgi:hypothetical protein